VFFLHGPSTFGLHQRQGLHLTIAIPCRSHYRSHSFTVTMNSVTKRAPTLQRATKIPQNVGPFPFQTAGIFRSSRQRQVPDHRFRPEEESSEPLIP
jgi:hypothetical protein